MKFQNPTIHRSKVNGRTHTQTDRQTHRQAKSNMPFQLFQSWGHNKQKGTLNYYRYEKKICLSKNLIIGKHNRSDVFGRMRLIVEPPREKTNNVISEQV